jgi:hypothetical protein
VVADKSFRPFISDEMRPVAEWRGVGADEREKVIRELLELSDALRPWPNRCLSLPGKIVSAHRCLAQAEIPHAIGGAVAVGYYGEPRSTLDIDVNVFVPAISWPQVRVALGPLDIDLGDEDLREIDEVRLDWESNSLHLFFSSDPLHQRMHEAIREVPFAEDSIPIVAPEHLVIRKAVLNRTKDWDDIEQILIATDPLDLEEIDDWLQRMVGEDNPQMKRLAEVKAGLPPD